MSNLLLRWWADTRGKVIVLLMILWVFAVAQHPTINAIIHPLFAVVLLVVFDVCFGWVRRKAIFFSLSSIVSGLLVGLLFDPSGSLWTILLACLVTSCSKQFLQKANRHIYNPAGLGVVLASLVFKEPVAWWAVAWGMLPVIILASWMVPVLWKMKRVWMPISFLSVYVISNIWFQNVEAAIRLTLDGTVFLFAFVMLPEPMTAVNSGRWKYMWGVLVGIFVLSETILKVAIGDPLLIALLGANLIGFTLTRLVTL